MFSSSPGSSTGSPRITRSHPIGPPRRTYSRRRTVQASVKRDVSDTESEVEEELEDRPNDGKGKVVNRQSIKATSQSSPSLGSPSRPTAFPNGSRSSSRLSRDQSSRENGTLTTKPKIRGRLAEQKDQVGANDEDEYDAEDCITAVHSQEAQDEEEGRDLRSGIRQKRFETPPPVSSTLSPSTPTPTPTPKKRKVDVASSQSIPRRSVRPTRSRSNLSAKEGPSEAPVPRRRDVTPPRTAPIAGPSTPTSSPRDYAHLFAAISPDPSILSSPSRKRIIGYSQSSGAVLDSPSKLRREFSHVYTSPGKSGPSTPIKQLGKTQSMPISPSKPLEDGDPSAMWIKPVEPEGQGSGGRAKRIYGRTRTVVAEDGDTVTDVEKLEEALSKESYASLRSRYEVNSGEATLSQEELSALLIARAPQSANDMRSKGENRRFMDETGYLLDGIEDESATKGFRRASCVDILGNMQNEEWLLKLNVCGQTERVWAAFQRVRGEADEIMDAVCLLALYMIMNGVGGIEGILRADAERCFRFVANLLRERHGVLDENWTGKFTSMVDRVRGISKDVPPGSPRTSTRLLASTILASLAKEAFGDLLNPIWRSDKVLGKTFKAILPEITALSERFDLIESGLPVVPHDDTIDIDHIRNGLVIVDYAITASAEDRRDLAQHHAGVPQAVLQALIAFTSVTLNDSINNEAALGVLVCLRIFANMSNISSSWSRDIHSYEGSLTALARIIIHRETIASRLAVRNDKLGEMVESTEEGELLCLVLAIVTSAVLADEQLASVLASLTLDIECQGQQSCLRSCRCSTAEPFVDELARLYASFQQIDDSEPETEVIASYLALLLSKIITAVPSSLSEIGDILPGDDTESKLGRIMSSLRALDTYRSTLQRKLKEETGSAGVEWQEDGNEVKKAIDDMLRLVDSY